MSAWADDAPVRPSPPPVAFVPSTYRHRSASPATDLGDGGGMGGGGGGVDGAPWHQRRFGDPDDDRPLWDELGIHPRTMRRRALDVLTPWTSLASEEAEEAVDFIGPLCFAVLLAGLVLLQGKVVIGGVYTLVVAGLLGGRMLVGMLASAATTVSLAFVGCTMGYSLVPCVLLAAVRAVGGGVAVVPLSVGCAVWAGWSAAQTFASAYAMEHQRSLLAVPLMLYYALFCEMVVL